MENSAEGPGSQTWSRDCLGRGGGSKAMRTFVPIIQNERQVYCVVITKSPPPKQSLGLGHVSVLRLR